MSDPYVGELRIFAGNFAPVDWAFCDGKLYDVSTYTELYSLIGQTYGGSGTSLFAVPDLRGRLPIGQGQGTGLTPYTLGASGGAETVTLTTSQLPNHTHTVTASKASGAQSSAQAAVWAAIPGVNQFIAPSEVKDPSVIHDMNTACILTTGAGAPHDNIMPSFALNFIICLNGLYPDRQ